jgi:high-affinity iron transporter
MDEYMQAMARVKEKIPPEYRIMDRPPVTPTVDSLHRGQELFAQNCAVCHGASGAGDGPATAALNPAPANFLDRKHSAFYGPGEKF